MLDRVRSSDTVGAGPRFVHVPGGAGPLVVEQFRLTELAADVHGANERPRACAAAVPVLLPDDVPGFVVTRYEQLRDFLVDPAVAKSPAHFAALRRGEIPDGWPLIGFAIAQRIFDAIKATGWPVLLSYGLQGSIATYP